MLLFLAFIHSFYFLPVSCGWLDLFLYNGKPEGHLVKTKSGFVKGFTMETEKYRRFYAFQGIPYAKPPIEDLRFKATVPVEPWEGILDATAEENICIQKSDINREIIGHEDCLYLNIYTPQLPETEDFHYFPVLLFIHGGSFNSKSGSMLLAGPKKFVEKNVVMVSINYRLGPFGFLSTGDEASPGNYAFFDQLMAMKWIKDNIHYFGGNSDAITLMGQSAGALCTSAHLVSPLAEGLFQRAVLHSGVILAPNTIDLNPLQITRAFAVRMNCPTSSTEELVNCLRRKSAKTLVKIGNKLQYENKFNFLSKFLPVIDGIFLPEHPQLLLERGNFQKIPILAGVNQLETFTFYLFEYQKFHRRYTEKEFLETYQLELFNTLGPPMEIARTIYPIIIKEYFNNSSDFLRTARITFNQILSDLFFNVPLLQFLSFVAPFGGSYMFTFEYRSSFPLSNLFNSLDKTIVSHYEEIPFLFDGIYSLIKRSSQDMKIGDIMLSLWSNFIKYGVPAPDGSPVDWFPITSDDFEYLEITKTFTMKSGFRKEKIHFMKDLLSKFKNKTILVTNESSLVTEDTNITASFVSTNKQQTR